MAIEVRGLTKVFTTGRKRARRSIEAVRDISFTVGPGERLAYIGPGLVFRAGLRRYTSGAVWTRA